MRFKSRKFIIASVLCALAAIFYLVLIKTNQLTTEISNQLLEFIKWIFIGFSVSNVGKHFSDKMGGKK